MVNVYIKEQINDQTTICAEGVTGNTTYLGSRVQLDYCKLGVFEIWDCINY